jgi:hypothetical protein
MAERVAPGHKVLVLTNAEYRTLMQALEYTAYHEGRGNVGHRCRELLDDIKPEQLS